MYRVVLQYLLSVMLRNFGVARRWVVLVAPGLPVKCDAEELWCGQEAGGPGGVHPTRAANTFVVSNLLGFCKNKK